MIKYKVERHKDGKRWAVNVYNDRGLWVMTSSVFNSKAEAVDWVKKLDIAKPKKQVVP